MPSASLQTDQKQFLFLVASMEEAKNCLKSAGKSAALRVRVHGRDASPDGNVPPRTYGVKDGVIETGTLEGAVDALCDLGEGSDSAAVEWAGNSGPMSVGAAVHFIHRGTVHGLATALVGAPAGSESLLKACWWSVVVAEHPDLVASFRAPGDAQRAWRSIIGRTRGGHLCPDFGAQFR